MVVNSHPLYQLSYAGIRCALSARAVRMLPEVAIGVKAPISLYYTGLRALGDLGRGAASDRELGLLPIHQGYLVAKRQ